MANLIEQAIACDDGDRAAGIIQDALGIENDEVAGSFAILLTALLLTASRG
jgi:hypothetical protein